jgi:hypothetical protein
VARSSIVGLSAVLYAKPDNCSDPTIPDSNRLAVCVIGIANSDNNPSLSIRHPLLLTSASLGRSQSVPCVLCVCVCVSCGGG